MRKSSVVLLIAIGMLMAIAAPLSANGTTQISGNAFFDDGECPPPPAPYSDFVDLTIIMTGDLEGCWYTKIDFENSKDNGLPSGVYQERGREVFVADDGSTFETTYKFTSKWDPQFIISEDPLEFGMEVHGRCQHPIVEGTGTGVFEGATGRVDFKDDVDPEATVPLLYRGHIKYASGE